MKSFKKFLEENYLPEEEVQGRLLTNRGTAQNFTNPRRIPFTGTDPTPTPASRRLSAGAPEGPKTSPGQLEIPEPKTTKVPGSAFKPATIDAASSTSPSTSGAPASAKPTWRPGGHNVNPTFKPQQGPKPAPAATPAAAPSGGKPPWRPGGHNVNPTFKPQQGPKPAPAAAPSGGKPPTGSSAKNAVKTADTALTAAGNASKLGKIAKFAGPASAALDTALSTADERSKGSGWARSLAKGATVAAGGLLGGTAGAIGGGGVLSAVTGTAGAIAGGAAAEKAFDTAAGANAVQRKAIATANRKSQAGGAIKGIGGKTTFDTKKNTITTGTGPQKRTAQLGKTSVITGPGGKQEVGNLAYKNGKAVYKRSDTKSLAQTSSNPLERIGRSLFAGAYKQSDAANAAKKLATARQSDSARNKALGVKFGPGK